MYIFSHLKKFNIDLKSLSRMENVFLDGIENKH